MRNAAPYTRTPGAASVHLRDLIAALPALAGLSFGIARILRGRVQRVMNWAWLLFGSAGYGLFVVAFGCRAPP